MQVLNRWLSLGLVLILGSLLGLLGFAIADKPPAAVEPLVWSPETQWIAPVESSYRFYARHNFRINGNVEKAWLNLSADNDFILYVNNRRLAQEISVYDNSIGFNNHLSEAKQYISDRSIYRVKNRANHLLAHARDWKLSPYIDLTPYLVQGQNTIALEIQKEKPSPKLALQGVVYLSASDTPINLSTGATPWLVSNLAENSYALPWFAKNLPDQNWQKAKVLGPVTEATYTRLSEQLFAHPLQGYWLSANHPLEKPVWLTRNWEIPQKQGRAFLRLGANSEYTLMINGLLVKHQPNLNPTQLSLYEITDYLHPGVNRITVGLFPPLEKPTIPSLFLDAWQQGPQQEILATLNTDAHWLSLTDPSAPLTAGKPVNLIKPVVPMEFKVRSYFGNAYLFNYPDFLLHQTFWQLGGIFLVFIYSLLLGYWLTGQRDWSDNLVKGTVLLAPGAFYLIAIGLLKHRYAETEKALWFTQPSSNYLILLGFIAIVILTLLKIKPQTGNWRPVFWLSLGILAVGALGLAKGAAIAILAAMIMIWGRDYLPRLSLSPSLHLWLLCGVILLAFALRIYQLDFVSLDWDENVSYDTIRGILRTGAPETTTGIWYTRSPAYHYLVAIWLWLVGDSITVARFLSVIFALASLILLYYYTREITKSPWIALLVVSILAVDSFSLWYARNLRFYQTMQFMTLLAFWSFDRGFIQVKGRSYQYLFFLSTTLMLLNQELMVTLLPSFLLGFFWFYPRWRWREDWGIMVGAFLTGLIFLYNGFFFTMKCLTPWVTLSTGTDAYVKFHLSNLTGFLAVFFVGTGRMYLIYSLFFFLGFFYFLIKKEGRTIYLFISVILLLLLQTVLSFNVGLRYTYGIYPLFIMLSVYSAITLSSHLGQRLELLVKGLIPLQKIALATVLILLVSNLELDRMITGYNRAINPQNEQIFTYIKEQLQPGDIIISNNPPAAAVSGLKLDYHLIRWTKYLDFANLYQKDGKIVDRAAGSQIISNVDQLQGILAQSQRVWLHYESNLRGDSATIRYLNTLGKPVMESFNTRLRLWQKTDGLLPRVAKQGKNLGSY